MGEFILHTRIDEYNELTAKEMEVLALLVEGLRPKQIARRLCVNVCTIRTHEARLHQKLNVRDRMTLVRKAEKLGLAEHTGQFIESV
jgi:DNA-binding NarL/FixJ family response regulator